MVKRRRCRLCNHENRDDLEAQLFVVSLLDAIKIDWTWKYSHLYPEYDTIGHKKKERVIA